MGDIRDECRRHTAMNEREKEILAEIEQRLQPPTQEEIDQARARWLFGKKAEKMMQYAPWSFALIKLMWKKGEEPWAS
jgi:hypothetical protein